MFECVNKAECYSMSGLIHADHIYMVLKNVRVLRHSKRISIAVLVIILYSKYYSEDSGRQLFAYSKWNKWVCVQRSEIERYKH